MGDNRSQSEDSRLIGPVKEDRIIGRAFVVIWPLGRFTGL
jgi:signal peptidase I